jgi:hypothetical protein
MVKKSHGDYKRKKIYGKRNENEKVEEKVTGRRKRRQKEEDDFKYSRNNDFFGPNSAQNEVHAV